MRPFRCTPRSDSSRGFTLIELLIVVAVVAVLLTLVAPSIRDMVLIQRLKSIHSQLVTDIQFARSDAVARGRLVSIAFRPGTSTDSMSCYTILTDNVSDNSIPKTPSDRCDCRQPAGSRCTANGTTEIRTTQIPRDLGLLLSLPEGQATRFAFDPVTGGLVLATNESGAPSGDNFIITTAVDSSRSLSAVVGLSGRPSVCKPSGSILSEPECTS